MSEELLAKLEAATGPDREIDLELMTLFYGGPRERWLTDELGRLEFGMQRKFTGSVDEALALVEKVLPGWDVCIARIAGPVAPAAWSADIGKPDTFNASSALKPTPALALCLALLRASKARGEAGSVDASQATGSPQAAAEQTTTSGE